MSPVAPPPLSEAGTALVAEVISRLQGVVPEDRRPALLHEPSLRGTRAWEYTRECLDSNWISTAGAFVERFERQLAEITGAADAVAVVNGTCALHLALEVGGVEPGDEVLCPAISFVATANAIRHAGALPHFVDVEEGTLGLDPEALERRLEEVAELQRDGCRNRVTGRRLKALVPVHVFGNPCQIERLVEIAARWRLEVVEDSAEALGSWRDGRHPGLFGRVGILSFNGNKIVSTGGGGALITHDPELARRARHLSTTAKRAHPWEYEHDAVGYNYRLPNPNAALGCAQLEVLDQLLELKRTLANRYVAALEGLDGISVFPEPAGTRRNEWLVALVLDAPDMALRDALLAALADAGRQSRPV